MTTPARPVPSVSGILEQLDELEALMRRMLTVPVEPGDGGPPPPQAQPTSPGESRLSAPAISTSVQEPAPASEEPRAAPMIREPVRTAPVPQPRRPEKPEPRVTAAWAGSATRVELAPRRVEAVLRRPGLFRRFLQGIDAASRAATRPWGPFGRWLDGDRGRAALGVLGILLLLGACSWGAWDWWSARGARPQDPNKPRLQESGAIN